VIGTGAGARAEVDFGLLMRKRGSIRASTLRARSVEEKEDVLKRLEAFMRPHVFQVPLEAAFPLAETNDAYERFARGGKFGKLVVVP
jgi:NADPH:quinone reductase-like Zn-dependent oxidoreductase